ncbi:hypothetical protein LSH36_229g04056 [Paralvinella palmiformis]|uniref:Aquaporin n=1 Tax=Paralvinella palmiformis TaxID=53620 RepID=A0AAD9JNT7_9ANNE|nr:hypothetical protein LSH36_229g04056 [Paralvinella palmiformis]
MVSLTISVSLLLLLLPFCGLFSVYGTLNGSNNLSDETPSRPKPHSTNMSPIKKSEYWDKLREAKTGAFWRDCFAELAATFLLVTAQLMLLQNWQTQVPSPQALAVQVAIGMCFVVGSIGYALGDFGGAHMNPAVTMAMFIRAEITIVRGVVYMIIQLAGGLLGAFFVYAISPTTQLTDSKIGNTFLGTDVLSWQGFLIEMTITTILCLTVLATGNIARKGYVILPSLPVGMALGLGLFLAISSTGASMNPARSLGPCVVSHVMLDKKECWTHHWVYWAGPLAGGLVAAVFYWIFDKVEKPKSPKPYIANPEYNYNNTSQYINTNKSVYPQNGYILH